MLERNVYLQEAIRLISNLEDLHSRTDINSSIYHRLLGSVIESTKCFISGIALSLSDVVTEEHLLKIHYPHDDDMANVIKFSHRTYFNQLHSVTSMVFMLFAKHHKIRIQNNFKVHLESEFLKLRTKIPTTHHSAIDSIEAHIKPPQKPQFNDYVEGLLGSYDMTKEQRKRWRTFFKAFTILRNKVSHESPNLTKTEFGVLAGSELNVIVSQDEFQVNFRIYDQLASSVLDFLDLLIQKAGSHSS